MASIP